MRVRRCDFECEEAHSACLFSQLPIKAGQQNTHTKVSTEHNKECLINISKYKFSLVISGLTNILKNVNNMVSFLILDCLVIFQNGCYLFILSSHLKFSQIVACLLHLLFFFSSSASSA